MSECKQHHWPNEEGKCPYCRNEELENECVQLKQGYTAIRNDMSRVSKAAKEVQQVRIEDLEEESEERRRVNVDLNQIIVNMKGGGRVGHFITTDQIRAAWKHYGKTAGGLGFAEELGIVRCEGCEGGSVTKLEKDNSYTGYKTIECPNCNGEGFKIGGEDG